MAKNQALQAAARARQDEFYTSLRDIEDELIHYKKLFKDKIVLCNCDDPYESNFFKYFAMNFNRLGLKKLIASCYSGSPITRPYCAEITERENIIRILDGNGDFRSPECVELLRQADIVVTNPPFSLFREYVALLMEYNKKFLIIGNKNAITYKEIFPLIMQNKIWLGVPFNGGNAYFTVPTDTLRYSAGVYDEEKERVKFRNVCWFTNLPHDVRNEEMTLSKRYYDDPTKYPKYDNYDAIEVSRVCNIPCDYDGVMGVPITFLDKYNPKQFEILGDSRYHDGQDTANDIAILNGKILYRRILIRRIM